MVLHWPRPAALLAALLATAAVGRVGAWTALVLSGGGAKGAYEVGVLESICQHQPGWANSWSMVSGTSIGALSAGILAQFPARRQCSHGVPLLRHYWDTTRTAEDVFQASHGGVCLTVLNPYLFWDFQSKGGLCDPAPGSKRYQADVKRHRIRRSGMMLRVLASSMRSGMPKWWSEQDDDVVEGCMASGSIAPLVYPMEVPVNSGNWYVDGSIFANTPILKALQEGAGSVLAILLDPLNNPQQNFTDVEGEMNKLFKNIGFTVINYYLNALSNNVFLGKEIESACQNFPHAQVYGYIPSADLGNLMNFTSDNIQHLIEVGNRDGKAPPVDLCEVAGLIRASRPIRGPQATVSLDWHISCNWMSLAVGILSTSLFFKKDALLARCRKAPRGHLSDGFGQQLRSMGEVGARS